MIHLSGLLTYFALFPVVKITVTALPVLYYVFWSLALMTLAKHYDISHRWLAWVPIGNLWILGSLADSYMERFRIKFTKSRVSLLCLSVLNTLTTIAIGVFGFLSVTSMAQDGFTVYSSVFDSISDASVLRITILLGCILLRLVLGLIQFVVKRIALYRVYSNCSLDNATTFTILGLFFPILDSIFLFVLRNREHGEPIGKTPDEETSPET